MGSFLIAADVATAAALRVLGLARTQRLLARWSRPRSPAPSPAEVPGLARIARRPSGLGRLRVGCLPRALVTAAWLERRGVSVALRIGVRPAGGRLAAHAWVELEGVPLGDEADVAHRFPPFDRDFSTT